MYGGSRGNEELGRPPTRGDEFEDGFVENLRLGHDVRFVLAAVGGGAMRVGEQIARRHVRYLETVAINCDPRVQELDAFDRRVCLGPESGVEGDTGGSPIVGGILARAAEPALERIFEGATFVTVIGSLGGGAGTGALPFVLEAAARSAEVLSVFAIKPFSVEGERRATADRALARLHFVDGFVEKQQRGLATLQILDNDSIARREPRMPFARLNAYWGELIAEHIERAFVIPAEAAVEAGRLSAMAQEEPMNRLPPTFAQPAAEVADPALPPVRLLHPGMTPAHAFASRSDAELTFEVDPLPRPPEAR